MRSSSLLLGPKARRAILSLTFLDPSREYHLRELVRRTRLAPRTVHQEIEKLVGGELLVERRDGNRRYLRANERHPLFAAVREIVLKTEGLASVVAEALGGDGIDFALVFGSIASGTPLASSDVDLLVVGPIGLREAVRRLQTAQDTLGREINPIVWTRKEFARRRREADPFLARVLDGPTIAILSEMPRPAR